MHINSQRFQRRDIKRMQRAIRPALGNIEEGRQKTGQRLAGAGRRKDDHILPAKRRICRRNLMRKPRPAARSQPACQRVRLETRPDVPIFIIMKWLNHELYIEPIDTYIDPVRPVQRAIITHGHADHARAGHAKVLATPQTIDIMKARYGARCAGSFQPLAFGTPLQIDSVTVTLCPAGHILGSAQVCLDYIGQRAVVTGDYKTHADSTAQAFELVPCDLFVTEATFGLPVFQHPDPHSEMVRLLASIAAQPDRCHVIGAYALGKAQRVIKLLREAGHDAPVYLHGAQEKLCAYYQAQGIDLGDLRKALDRDKDSFRGHVVVAPPSALRDRWSRRLPDPVVCQASGWMTIKQRAKQSGVELPLVISDHADWNELTGTISATGAETVWVTHGREDALVHWCRQRGLDAEPLYLQGREEDSSE